FLLGKPLGVRRRFLLKSLLLVGKGLPLLGQARGPRLELRHACLQGLLALLRRGREFCRPVSERSFLLGKLRPLLRDRLPLLRKTRGLRLEHSRVRRQVQLALLRSSREPPSPPLVRRLLRLGDPRLFG